jgi:opacity protein-like surface antigen
MLGLYAAGRMTKQKMFGRSAQRSTLAPLAVLLAGVLFSSAAGAEPQETAWEFSLTPYLWLPHLDAALRYETPGSGGTPISMSDLLKHLDGALFLSGEARRGSWGLAADLVYCDFHKVGSDVTAVAGPSGESAVPVNTGTTTSLTGYMVSVTGNYSLVRQADNNFEVLAGVRYTHIGTTLDWSFDSSVGSLPARTGSVEQGVDLWDGVAGFRGKVSFGAGKWFVPYYLDAGAGTSKFTWQGMLGIGYAFGWGELLLAYRYLSFEQGDSEPVEHFRLSGLALGATFHF